MPLPKGRRPHRSAHTVGVLFVLDQVAVSRAGAEVLSDVTLSLPEGSSCIFGPSGSGKSTLLRLLNRLRDPDRGTIAYRGRDLRELDVLALRREVALVPQLPALIDGTVADNVSYGPQLAGRAVDLDEALGRAGLASSFAPVEAARLSVGEQQRVMLARALALRPSVLLLDEPTSALDERARTAVEATLLELSGSLGVSLVLVTHDLAQARRLADRIIGLEDGRVVDHEPDRAEPRA